MDEQERIRRIENLKKDDMAVIEFASPRSVEVADGGIKTTGDFAKLMSALITDVIKGDITPSVANAAVNAGGRLLKMVEMQIRYSASTLAKRKSLPLIPE